MYSLIRKETEQQVLDHFNELEISGVGYETTTPKVVWHNYVPHDYSQDYLTFTALEDTTFTFIGATTSYTLQYSLDNGTSWQTLARSANTPIVNAGNKILWKKTGLNPNPNYGLGRFSSTGNFKASGNIMSLYYGDNFVGQTNLVGKNKAFLKLFSSCNKLVTTKNLILPATALASECYSEMFLNCTSLTTAPELPATTLAYACYQFMFRGCTSLTTAPKLTATTLADSCYSSMFFGCSSLTTAPELSITTLAPACYSNMFNGCTSLTTAPDLPATTLISSCYSSMFKGCTSLTTAPDLPATTLSGYCYSCYQYMFQDCTSLTTAPELPATTLAQSCYGYMFDGCTSLTTAPELPATTLAQSCYSYMFRGCTSLNYIKCLATDISASNCTTDWVNGVSATGTFVKASSMSSWATGTSGIPSGWDVRNA